MPLLIFVLPNKRNNKIKLKELYINQDKFINLLIYIIQCYLSQKEIKILLIVLIMEILCLIILIQKEEIARNIKLKPNILNT